LGRGIKTIIENAEAKEAVKVGRLKDLSIIEVIACNIAWVECEAHFSWVWGHPLRKICKNTCRC